MSPPGPTAATAPRRLPPLPLPRLLLGAALAPALLAPAAEMTPEQRAFFESKIRPVLVKQCYECHSTSAKKVGGKLLLDSPPEMLTGGESGPALIPGRPEDSLLIQALRYDGAEMPPDKPLPPQIIADFETWVKMGAPDPRPARPGAAASTRAPAQDKEALWAYQPLSTPAVPRVKEPGRARTTLDLFIQARQEKAGLRPAPEAGPATLIRRLSFALTGLPPAFEEVRAFEQAMAASPAPDQVYAALVERLLASSHFGERWGRHWLDVARYGESNGNDGLSRNASFPHAWRYRDYVVRAFNEDTPYDRFITEQIAGDLLPAATPAERDRLLTATGFLAIGSKPAKAMNDNFEMDVVADQIAAVGSGILGLSVGCARCHDHKTDPIPTRDYYALAGIFKSTETLWGAAAFEPLTAPQTTLHLLTTAPPVRPRPELEPALKRLEEKGKAKKPGKPVHNHPPDAPLAMGVREAKQPADCRINLDGESKKLGPAVPRGFLSACGAVPAALPAGATSGRLELARWLAHPGNPLTARVMVNRVWHHLFGTGLVRTPDDFGVTGARPTHPELLDHLAARFMAEGWSVKQLIRGIVLSSTYRAASAAPGAPAKDPENLLLGRHPRRRLDAEALRDSMLAASGSLDRRPAQGSLIQHRDVLINQLGDLHQPSPHRSLYLLMLRNSPPPELAPFNLPDGTAVTGRRDESTLPTQALYLLNNGFVVEQGRRLAARLIAAHAEGADRVQAAYQAALARNPTAEEVRRALDFVVEAATALASSLPDGHAQDPTTAAWAAFAQALLAGNEFRYLD